MNTNLYQVNLELIHSLWVPNIFIYNLKTFQVIDVLSKLAGLWVDKNKRIYYSQATHITFICPMLFDSFPLDTQSCKFQVGSYSYDLARMVFAVSTLGYIQRNQSIVMDYKININNLPEKDKVFDAGALGNFSLAGFEMTLERHMLSYIITYYLPSGLFVVVSWISFLIPPDIVPGRMALLITIFLVLINIFNNITTNSPKAEGLTAIEIWMLACILFVFGALVEYAVILYRKQKAHHYMSPSYSPSYQGTCSSTSYNSMAENGEDYREEKYGKNIHTCKDQTSTDPEHGRGQGAPLTTIYMDNINHSKIPEIRQRNGKTKPKDSLKRENSKRSVLQQHSTWQDRYARVDRFFLFFCPFLFMVFNLLYWGHYQVRCTWCQAD